MASLFEDQAAGLRKLFAGARGPTTFAFAGCAGHGGLVAGLARGLAAAGKEVLVIDGCAGEGGVAAAFGLRSRYDLLQAVNRDVPAAKVLLRPEPAIRLLPAARAARLYDRLDVLQRQALAEGLRRLQKGADFVLVDAAQRAEADFPPQPPQRIVVAVAPDGPSITEAYAQMKRLARLRDCRRFGIVVLRAATVAEGHAVFANLREVAQRHLGAELELLGRAAAGGEPHQIGLALAESLLEPASDGAAGGHAAPGRSLRGATSGYPAVLVPASGSGV